MREGRMTKVVPFNRRGQASLPIPARTTLADQLDELGHRGHDHKLRAPQRGLAGIRTGLNSVYFDERDHRLSSGYAKWYERKLERDSAVNHSSAALLALLRSQRQDMAHDAENSAPVKLTVSVDELAGLHEQLMLSLPAREERRAIEGALSDYVAGCADVVERDPKWEHAAGLMRDWATRAKYCRVSGHVGRTESGGLRVAYDLKCENVRLCPDEAREHVRKVADKYVAEMLAWKQRESWHGRRRLHYAVFTVPNVPVGFLKQGIDDALEQFKRFLDTRMDCTEEHRERYGYGKSKKQLDMWRPAPRKWKEVPKPGFPDLTMRQSYYDGEGIHGALVQLECPMSARGDWNIHLNVILCTDGPFDYEKVREVWGHNVEFPANSKTGKRLAQCSDQRALAETLNEMIKYAAQHCAEKSEHHRRTGQSAAPPMMEWGPHAFAEWFDASHRSRWLRSYGCLFKVAAPKHEREQVLWLGRITLTDSGTLWVDLPQSVGLIQGFNFRNSGEYLPRDNYRVPGTGNAGRGPPSTAGPPGARLTG